ncbi:ATP-grasp domain-containing protein [Rhizocola hellebori]|uniref:ATP-grasp domain-containing protein n=1 Tax=Rhizocola hellebori TaxID=1392758 RepID=A0A8J3VG47_9ACTN|nr:ATP-grasp domain-containing protein [Rhizocola hellebori]
MEPDDQLVIPALAALGIEAVAAVWDDPAVDWPSFDATVLRSPWDYATRRDEFVRWARRVPRLANSVDVVEWNTDKRYLGELAASGVPVTPTTFIAPSEMWLPPTADGEYVIKPSISAGSKDTGRYGPGHRDEAIAHVSRLQRDRRVVMVQPYLSAVDTYGETALLYFADPASGRLIFSHAIRKGPMLEGPDVGVEGLYKPETISARVPSQEELAVAEAVLMTLPGGLLYARIDLIPDPDGNPVLLEVELTEPSLFLEHSDGAPARFAAAIAGLL